jgi:hypothetical protein
MVPWDFLYQSVKENFASSFFSKVVIIRVYGLGKGAILPSRDTFAAIK